MRPVWCDGAIVARDAAVISVLAHPMQRGSLVFDVTSFHEVRGAAAVFRLRDHVERLLRSAAALGMHVPYTVDELCAATHRAVDATKLREGLIRHSAFFPDVEADVVPRDSKVSVVIAAYGHADVPKKTKPPACLAISIPRDMRKAAPDAIPAHVKVAAAYLGPMIARRRALAEGFDEVVLLDHQGRVGEAPTANVLAVLDGALVTPPLECVLGGITRDSIMTIARDEGIAVHERHLSPEELAHADEAFLTASSYRVFPIASVDRVPLAAPGPITERLRTRFTRIVSGDDARSADWLSVG